MMNGRNLVVAGLVASLGAFTSVAGELATNGCLVKWTERSVTVANPSFSKTCVSVDGCLRTASFKATTGAEWQTEKFANREPITVTADFTLELSGIFGDNFRAGAEIIAGRGTATVAGGRLLVSIPERLDYLWVRLSRKE